jgi:hypothetical protein
MGNEHRRDLVAAIAPRVSDLRSEFEAQLRAVGRLEQQLQKTLANGDPDGRGLAESLRRGLRDMLDNNLNVRSVLIELATETGMQTSAADGSALSYSVNPNLRASDPGGTGI